MVDALVFASDDIHRQDRQHSTVHRHGDGHLLKRNTVEKNLHILDRVDGDAGLADIADDAFVIRIVTAMRGEVEGDGKAHLPGL